ncbi:pseudouridine synthase [Mangrovimonas sp. YM274]|uniref:pseudouridine synthase n=1 Tax=Mangrovimonas sp. YM274 TaxID=3070660 RepID=UPI0027DC9932|nr:pseudouridine synthase [Mangrovimonas sp. YM274]WMI67357.1 pseudouridine synthase [Mangrovimonas sp. YM274]
MSQSKEKHKHFKIYKPFGYLSQFMSNAKHEQKKKFLGELYEFPEDIMAIGRLDKNSEGLLLLTTDGQLSYDICSSKIDKEYYVQVDGLINQEAINKLQKGVEIGFKGIKYITKPCDVTLLQTPPNLPDPIQKIRDDRHGPTSWISVIINEGKYRQVRKMTSAVGFPTLRLVRVRVGNYTIDNMQPGDVVPTEVSV